MVFQTTNVHIYIYIFTHTASLFKSRSGYTANPEHQTICLIFSFLFTVRVKAAGLMALKINS